VIKKGIHPSATIDFAGKLHLPETTIIEPSVTIFGGPGASLVLGDKNTIYPGVVIRIDQGSMVTGKEVSFGPGCLIYEPRGGLEIGDYCLLAGGVMICGVQHGFEDRATPIRHQLPSIGKVVIESDVWLGMGVKVLPGVTIGKGSIIGAGSVVDKSVPPGSVAVGIPCRVVRQR
jgi:acetyltransferase-like isoleucine patch superfamily enzyme